MPPSRLFRSIIVFGTALGAGSVAVSGCTLFETKRAHPLPDAYIDGWHGIIDAPHQDGWSTIADAANDAAHATTPDPT